MNINVYSKLLLLAPSGLNLIGSLAVVFSLKLSSAGEALRTFDGSVPVIRRKWAWLMWTGLVLLIGGFGIQVLLTWHGLS